MSEYESEQIDAREAVEVAFNSGYDKAMNEVRRRLDSYHPVMITDEGQPVCPRCQQAYPCAEVRIALGLFQPSAAEVDETEQVQQHEHQEDDQHGTDEQSHDGFHAHTVPRFWRRRKP